MLSIVNANFYWVRQAISLLLKKMERVYEESYA